MTPEQIALVQASAVRVAPRLDSLGEDFYARLFAEQPELRPMFPADNAEQQKKFADSLAAIVAAIPDFPAFAERARTLGRLHAGHRVSAAQYDVVGAVLLRVLAEHDDAWDDATAQAWGTAYAFLAESMLLGARS